MVVQLITAILVMDDGQEVLKIAPLSCWSDEELFWKVITVTSSDFNFTIVVWQIYVHR